MKQFCRILALLLTLPMLLAFAACSAAETDVPAGFILAENQGADYSFYYPETWLIDRSDAGMTSVYVSENDFTNLSVTAFTADTRYSDLPTYADQYYFKQMEGNLNEFQVERNQDGSLKRTVLKVDGLDAIAVNYSAVLGGEHFSYRIWFISYNGYIYHVQYCGKVTGERDLYQDHLDEAEAIVSNLRFN
ncbi:MAG: hypothetical protein IJC84_05220 [Clostridia bacterium]|nr:hypothetical protein [Clostridia bacterium]